MYQIAYIGRWETIPETAAAICDHDTPKLEAVSYTHLDVYKRQELNLSRRTVERAIQDLVKAGLIKKEQRWRENGGKSSLLYTLIDSS